MIYCPGCGTANRDGSRFCNECGTKLPTTTSSLCPTCSTANPPHTLFCEKCGTRLVPSLADEAEEPEAPANVPLRKGLSLPTKSSAADSSAGVDLPAPEPVQPAEQLDWLSALQLASDEEPQPDTEAPLAASDIQPPGEEALSWFSRLTGAEQAEAEPPPADELPEWAQRLRTISPAPAETTEEEAPDWLKTLSATSETPAGEQQPSAFEAVHPTPIVPAQPQEEMPDWMRGASTESQASQLTGLELPKATPEPQPAAQEELPDWLRELRPAAAPAGDLPDWLDDLAEEAAAQEAPPPELEETPEEPASDGAFEWLNRLADTGPLHAPPAQQISASEQFSALPLTDEKAEAEESSWLSGSGEATEETQPEESLPDWVAAVSSPSAPVEEPAQEEPPGWLIGAGIAAAAIEKPDQPAAEEVPDWLSALRGSAESMEEPEAATEGAPDWLAGTAEASTAEETSDWLSALRGSAESMEEPEAATEGAPDWLAGTAEASTPEETSDWLSALRGSAESMEEPEAATEGASDWLAGTAEASTAEETPDWLSALRGSAEPTEEPEAATEGVPDWLAGMTETAATEEAPAPDWLQAISQETPATEKQSAEFGATEPAGEGVPEWLKDAGLVAGAAVAASAPEQEEQPLPDWLVEAGTPSQGAQSAAADWLGSLRVATPEISEEEPAEAAVPDWLSGTEAPAQEPEPTAAPDWMSSLRAAAPEIDQQPEEIGEPDWLRQSQPAETVPSEPLADVPDWLRDYGAGESAPAAQITSLEVEPASDQDIPDWLKEAGIVGGAAAVAARDFAAGPEPEGEMPDWLRDIGEQPAVAFRPAEVPDWLSEEEQPPESAEMGEVPAWLSGAPGSAPLAEEEQAQPESLDWLRDLTPAAMGATLATAAEIGEAEAPAEPAAEEPEEAEKPQDWIKTVAPAAAVGAVAGLAAHRAKEEPAVAPAELPDWLQQLRQEQAEAPVQPALTQAEIPAWLEALRPAEVEEGVGEAAAEVEAEKEGPLAGLVSVLPAAPVMGQVQGLPASLRYEVSADDQARAGVLQELMARPVSTPRKAETYLVKSGPMRRRALRWVITALLLTVLLLPPTIDLNQELFEPALGANLLPNVQTMEVPVFTQLAAAHVGALPAGAPVLVVFDYDASQSDEMNRVAEVFFKHLVARGANVQVASLNPQGPGIAQSVWNRTFVGQPTAQFVNQGFVPGQAIGIQSLLKASEPVLVIELAASPDTVRWWAEQLTLSGKNLPLVVGLSAGAQMLTLPYAQAGQVGGMVVGASGALAYARQVQLPLLAVNQFELEALSLASWLMAVLVGVALLMMALSRPGRRSTK